MLVARRSLLLACALTFISLCACRSSVPLTDLSYRDSNVTLYVEQAMLPLMPTVKGDVETYTVSPALPAGITINRTSGVISGTPTAAHNETTYTVAAYGSGDYLKGNFLIAKVTIKIEGPTTGIKYLGSPFTFWQGQAAPPADPTFQGGAPTQYLFLDSEPGGTPLPEGLTIDEATGTLAGTPAIVQPETAYLVEASNPAGSSTAVLKISVHGPVTSISYSASPTVVWLGESVNLQPTVQGVAMTFEIDPSLPMGLSLNPVTGMIAGKATQAIEHTTFTITASNLAGSANGTLELTVLGAPSDLSYGETTTFVWHDGESVYLVPTCSGVGFYYEVEPELPTGLAFDSITGAIEGSPTTGQEPTSYVVTAANGAGSISVTLSIEIQAGAPTSLEYSGSPFVFASNQPIVTAMPTWTGGKPTGYSIDRPLPDGLNFDPETGSISGTAGDVQAAAEFTVTGWNGDGAQEVTISIVIADEWMQTLTGGYKSFAVVFGLTRDEDGSLYIVGQTNGDLVNQSAFGADYMFLTKYSAAGEREWTRFLGDGLGFTRGKAVVSDGSSIYVAAASRSRIDELTPVGAPDLLLTKWDKDGNRLWATMLGTLNPQGGLGSAVPSAIALDARGDVYVAGYTSGALDGETFGGLSDAFVVRYRPNGDRVWTRLVGASGSSIGLTRATAMVVASKGIYVAGQTNDSLDGSTWTNSRKFIFLSKLDFDGDLLWVRMKGNPHADAIGQAMARDAEGHLYIVGDTTGSVDGQTYLGAGDVIVVEYDSSGNWEKTALIGASGATAAAMGVAIGDGGIYIVGHAQGSFSGRLCADYYPTAFVARLDDDLGVEASKLIQVDNTPTDSVAVLSAGSFLYVGGIMADSAATSSFVAGMSERLLP